VGSAARIHHPKPTAAFSKSPVIDEQNPAAHAPPRTYFGGSRRRLDWSPGTTPRSGVGDDGFPNLNIPRSQS